MVDFAFTGGYSATAGNYVIVVSYSGGDASNYLKVAMDGTHLGHAGNFAYYNSSTWTANNARDMIFKIYTTVTDATSYNGRYLGTIMTTSTAGFPSSNLPCIGPSDIPQAALSDSRGRMSFLNSGCS